MNPIVVVNSKLWGNLNLINGSLTINAVRSIPVVGATLVTNGDFATGDLTGWTAAAGWSAATNKAVHNGGIADTTALVQPITVVSGATYQIQFTIASRTTGSITATLGAVTVVTESGITAIVANETISVPVVAAATGAVNLSFTPTATFNGSIDDVQIKLVTLQSALPIMIGKDDAGGSFAEIRGSYASSNLAIGYGSLQSTIGIANTAFGSNALSLNITGYNNTAIGINALSHNTLGPSNVAVGANALQANTSGSQNVAVGSYALTLNTSGYYNTAVGSKALWFNTIGYENTAYGHASLYLNTEGYQNTAYGSNTLYSNTTGNSNTAVGMSALGANTTASSNTGVGYSALSANTTGYENSAVGANVLNHNTEGYKNTAFGVNALATNVTGNNNVAIGHHSLFANTGSGNTAVGVDALDANTSGASNVAVGISALTANTTASGNVGIGYLALYGTTTGGYNTAVGYLALYSNITGTNNVAIGNYAGAYETGPNAFYVDTLNRVNTAGDKAGALLYGTFHATPASQTLRINATVTLGVAIPAFVANDKYLVVDANGNIHVSALGPLS